MFFCEICEICKNTYFEEHMLTAPSVIRLVSSSQAINQDKIVHDVINSFNVDFMFPKNKIIMKEPGNCKSLITVSFSIYCHGFPIIQRSGRELNVIFENTFMPQTLPSYEGISKTLQQNSNDILTSEI